MDNLEKKNLINNRIDNMNVHIEVLEADILNNPDSDIDGKTPRSEVLNNFKDIKAALLAELDALDSSL